MDTKINDLKIKLKKGELILMDGGTGSEIAIRGVKTSLPLWSAQALLTDPLVVKQIHRDYIEAGAEIIITNTFRTNERTFRKANFKNQAKKATVLACKLAKEAVKESGKDVLVAGSIAPLEDCYSPNLVPAVKELKKEHLENAQYLKSGGVDFILLETMISIDETISACQAAEKVGLPLAVSFCCNEKSQLLSGEGLEEAVKAIEKYKPLFISLNCMNLKTITKVITNLRKYTKLPIGAYAQGDGEVDDKDGWVGGGTEAVNSYLQEVKAWVKNGVQVIGGCCGTNPEYIQKLNINMSAMMQTPQKGVSL